MSFVVACFTFLFSGRSLIISSICSCFSYIESPCANALSFMILSKLMPQNKKRFNMVFNQPVDTPLHDVHCNVMFE